ncbi:hypothetical protein H107_02800, partial [Trichophyton rubrum CBS 202.88]
GIEMAALDACQQQPHSQQPQVDQLEETAVSQSLHKLCSNQPLASHPVCRHHA